MILKMLNPAETNQNSPKYNEGKVTRINLEAFEEKKRGVIPRLIPFVDIENLKRMETEEALGRALIACNAVGLALFTPKGGKPLLSPQEQGVLSEVLGYLKGFLHFHRNFLSVKPNWGITREIFWQRVEEEAIPTFRRSLTLLTRIDCSEGQIFISGDNTNRHSHQW